MNADIAYAVRVGLLLGLLVVVIGIAVI